MSIKFQADADLNDDIVKGVKRRVARSTSRMNEMPDLKG